MAISMKNGSSSSRIRAIEGRIRTLQYALAVLAAAVVVLAIYSLYPSIASAFKPQPLSFGHTLAGIDTQFSSQQLSVINGAPNSYFEIAGERLLNGTLTDEVLPQNSPQFSPIIINGKPSVIYIGAISCIFCGENRWSMALALSRFGNFSRLYVGYSSFGDGDIPTVYWNYNNYSSDGVTYGSYYNSRYINFYPSEYDSNITQGFQVQPLPYFIQRAPNSTYAKVLTFMNSTNGFQGTPFTFWGTSLNRGADAVVLGNTTPTSSSFPLTNMTHQQVLNQLQNFSDQFAWGEYAGADVYIAEVCPSINNAAPVCSLPAIKQIGAIMGLSS